MGHRAGAAVRTGAAVAFVLTTVTSACGEGPGPSPDDAAPQACDVPDGDNADGPVSVAIQEFTHEPGPVDDVLLGRATVTNTSDTSVRLNGEGDEVLYAFLVNEDGGLLTTLPEADNLSDSMADLAPGESVEWTALLTLRLCGGAAGSPVPAGAYDAHVWMRLGVGDPTGSEELLSVESIAVEVG